MYAIIYRQNVCYIKTTAIGIGPLHLDSLESLKVETKTKYESSYKRKMFQYINSTGM